MRYTKGAKLQKKLFKLSPILYPLIRLYYEYHPFTCPECGRRLSPAFFLYYRESSKFSNYTEYTVNAWFNKIFKRTYPRIGVITEVEGETVYCIDCYNKLTKKK